MLMLMFFLSTHGTSPSCVFVAIPLICWVSLAVFLFLLHGPAGDSSIGGGRDALSPTLLGLLSQFLHMLCSK